MKSKNKLLYRYISKSVLFSGLEKKELLEIASLIKQKFYNRGEKIIIESTFGKDIYFIISGKVVVYLGEKNKKKIIDYLQSGNVLGEIGFFTGMRSATCECIEPTVVGVIRFKDFYNLIARNTSIAMNIIKILSKRLLSADHEIKNLVFKPVLARVSQTLLEFLGKDGNVNISITELAEKVGANRETVSRIISLLEKLNYLVRSYNNKIKIINKERIKLLSER